MKRPRILFLGVAAVIAMGLTWPSRSDAGSCSVGIPNPVVVAGSPAMGPLIEKVAKSLRRDDPSVMTVVWQLTSSCAGVEALAFDPGPPALCPANACIRGQALLWTLDGADTTPKPCDLDAAGTRVDLALSDVDPVTCPAFAGISPGGLIEGRGPISPYALVMDKQATEAAIQAEEAHFVFGTGRAAGIKPWLSNETIFLLGSQDAGQLLLAPRIQLPISQWRGKLVSSPTDVLNGLPTDPTVAIGILPTALADPRRGDLRILAFQAVGQHGAFYPDRKAASFEKQNVRDGHYPLWGYVHTLLAVSNPPQPIPMPRSVSGKRLADILVARGPLKMKNEMGVLVDADLPAMQVAAGLVPACAMRVKRDSDTGPLIPALPQPADSCSCWFESAVRDGHSSCMTCPDGVTCAVGKCSRFFCEVQ